MIADTTFLIHFASEGFAGRRGRARTFFAQQRSNLIRTSIISVGEASVGFPTSAESWDYFKFWRIYPLHRGVAQAASDLDRELSIIGHRLGENDNWIAGFCRYYREPIISLDADFDRVPGLRRIPF
jgi:predicted nucleic acid-binding protein